MIKEILTAIIVILLVVFFIYGFAKNPQQGISVLKSFGNFIKEFLTFVIETIKTGQEEKVIDKVLDS